MEGLGFRVQLKNLESLVLPVVSVVVSVCVV